MSIMSRVRVDPREPAAVFLGGFAGALARAALGEGLPAEPGTWPWATFAVNLAGAFLLGLVLGGSRLRRSLLGTGFCGALTTFATFQLELLRMLDLGQVALALGYAVAIVTLGLAAVAAGARLRGVP